MRQRRRVGHPVYLLVGHPLRNRLFHDVVKRSQGGSDFDLDQLVALCRWCHDQTDAPYERGRLVVTSLGAGQFTFEVVVGPGIRPARVATVAHVGKIPTLRR